MTPDVIIAGAGPAGAVAACVLASAGARVLVLDRARFPRPKLCGDTINPGALAVLRRLRLDDATAGGLPIHGMIVTGESSVRVVGTYPNGTQGVSLSRRILDARLVEIAAARGASIEEGILVRGPLIDDEGAVVGVEISRGGSVTTLHAPVVIAADGHFSRLARALRLSRSAPAPRRWALGGLFEGVLDLGTHGEMHVRRDHYIGVAPLPGGVANACLVSARPRTLQHPEALHAVILGDPLLRTRFSAARLIGRPTLLGPLAVDATAAGTRGLLLAGDAAGFIDPMTGDGLRFAVRGAELAAIEARRVLEQGWQDAHVRLARARRDEFASKWRFNRTLRALVGAPVAVRAATIGATIAPAVLRRVIQYAGDAAGDQPRPQPGANR